MTDSKRSPIVFADGVDAQLIALEQKRTYAGWLEGVPNTVMNIHLIGKASEGLDVVRPPQVRPLEEEVPASWGKAEVLPGVQVTATFSSHQTRRPDGLQSALSMVWWQDAFIENLHGELNAVTRTVPWWDHAQEWTADEL